MRGKPDYSRAGAKRDALTPDGVVHVPVWRRFLNRIGFRNRVFSDTDTGLVPESGGVGATYYLDGDGAWSIPAGSGGVTDGDKGEITVSGGGTSWTINTGAVDYDQIQDVRDERLLGRSAGTDGPPQEITVGTGLSLSGGDLSTATALAAISALTPAADRLAYFTGATTAALATLTSFIRTLLDDADAATARTTLGAQASNANLLAIAGLTTAADRLSYWTGSGTAALATLTSFARTILDDADAATVRTTIGAAASGDIPTIPEGLVTILESAYGNPILDIATTTPTNAYSVTIPANTLPGSKVMVRIMGYVVQNSGAAQNVSIVIKLGGTTYYYGGGSWTNSANPQLFTIEVTLAPRTTGGQFLFCDLGGSAATTASTGYGNPGTNGCDGFFGNHTVAKDETTSLALDVQMCFQTSATSSQIRIYGTETKLVPYV